MKKNFVFFSVNGDGVLSIELELKKTEKGDVFSASGVFRARNGRIESAGQILDGDFIFASKKDENLFLDIKRLWQLYHLNDWRADCGCGINESLAQRKIKVYEYRCKHSLYEIRKLINRIKINKNLAKIADFKHVEKLLNTGWEFKSTLPLSKLPRFMKKHYALQKVKEEAAGWVRYSKLCPDGVLCRPCPKCGKEYGGGWYFKEIPADDVEKIKLIMEA